MTECVFLDKRKIGNSYSPYIVAEVNTSHNGSVETAKKMIDEIKQAGCDCVKFQSWSSKTLYSKSYYKENPIAERFVKKFAFSNEQLLEVAKYSKEKKIAFASTPYSEKEVDFLLEYCDVPYIKIASMDLNNYPFLKYIAKTKAPIVLSTGMGSLEEIRAAIKTIEDADNYNICILHCTSIYPTTKDKIYLKNILGLKKHFPNYPIGFSDHSLGIELAPASIALGASLIEKHFTLDRSKIGMDNQMAIEKEEMKQLVKNCHSVSIALGGEERYVSSEELEQRLKMRRSIVSKRNLKAGTILSEDDLDLKRPGTGLSPDKIEWLIGKKLLIDVEEDTLIQENAIANEI